MATKNSSFLPKKNRFTQFGFLFLALTACQTAPRTEVPARRENPPVYNVPGTRPEPTTPPPVERTEEQPTAPGAPPTPPMAVGVAPKVGLILGPGALRSYAHVGIVQEFVKQRMPIHAVAGIEMGALVAAIYANKGQPYDVEWQMMKLKESDILQKGLLSSQVKAGDVRSLQDFIKLALSSNRAENAKVNFSCPALQIDKQQVYMMNRGAYADMLSFCVAFPPLFRPHQQNVAAVNSIKAAADQLRAKGANYVIYVDLLSGPVKLSGSDLESQVLWGLAAEASNRTEKGVDYVIHVPLKDYDLLDFNRRREMIQKGQQAAHEASSQIMKNLNW